MPTEAMAAKGKPEISMRHSKLTAADAAKLSGEVNKPSWESRNEGIHERVSFEDSIWGFDLAGGSFYQTPLRVTAVHPDSRADKAGIRAGDRLLRINDIDTSTLTIQEAHEIIIESGVHLRIAVTAPDDEEDSYHCWQDQLDDGYDSEEERRKQKEKERKIFTSARVSSYWSLQWPWVSKRRVIYRESNCFMVPSKFESNHRDKFPLETNFGPKVLDDVVLHSVKPDGEVDDNNPSDQNENKIPADQPLSNGDLHTESGVKENSKPIDKDIPIGDDFNSKEIVNEENEMSGNDENNGNLSEVSELESIEEVAKEQILNNGNDVEVNGIGKQVVEDNEEPLFNSETEIDSDNVDHAKDSIVDDNLEDDIHNEPELDDAINDIIDEINNKTEEENDEILDNILNGNSLPQPGQTLESR